MTITVGEFNKLATLTATNVAPNLTNILRDAQGRIYQYQEGPAVFTVSFDSQGRVTSVVRTG
jgi:hypothetical protein